LLQRISHLLNSAENKRDSKLDTPLKIILTLSVSCWRRVKNIRCRKKKMGWTCYSTARQPLDIAVNKLAPEKPQTISRRTAYKMGRANGETIRATMEAGAQDRIFWRSVDLRSAKTSRKVKGERDQPPKTPRTKFTYLVTRSLPEGTTSSPLIVRCQSTVVLQLSVDDDPTTDNRV
uniref:Ig-like domain-containing protein n=1 Tax=Ascaris lumbricoides TaxID=6252 RepID=A0A0M3HZD6_ASCLU